MYEGLHPHVPHLQPPQPNQAGDRVARRDCRLCVEVERYVHERAETRHGRVLPAPAERRARALQSVAPFEIGPPRPVELFLVCQGAFDIADALRHLIKLAAAPLPRLDLFALLRELARGRAQVRLRDVEAVLLCFDLGCKVGTEALNHRCHICDDGP